jgi:hypothetical protein
MATPKRQPSELASTRRAYEVFRRAADGGNYRQAFEAFKAQPHLLNHMTLLEIPVHCASMSQQLGKDEVSEFIKTAAAHLGSAGRMLQAAREYDKIVREQARSAKRG